MSAGNRARSVFLVCALGWAALGMGCGKAERAPSGGVSVASSPAPSQGMPKATQRSLEVTASFDVELSGADAGANLSRSLSALASESGGYVEQLELGDGSRDGRMVVRAPASELGRVRELLASNGPVAHEVTTTKDATDAIADIDARVKSATLEETRIQKLLDERTGSLADVLATEKALAEVRENIERLEAEQRVAHGRVDLATIIVSFKYPLAASDVPFVHRAGVAASDGITFAKDVATGGIMLALRAGPTFLILGAFAFACVRLARKLLKAQKKAPMT